MKKISIDYSKALNILNANDVYKMQEKVTQCHNMLHKGTGEGSEYVGWVDLPNNYDKKEFERIKRAGEKIRKDSDVLLVAGIGGSYLGARAAIEMLSHTFYNELPKEKRKGPKIYYIGHNISSTYISELLETIKNEEVSVNVVSKSGTTTETALAFRILREFMEDKYGEKAGERIYATTDKSKGALKTLADNEGYESFVIPDDVGGRYSVLTPVGLLPIAAAGINIDEMMEGALDAFNDLSNVHLEDNEAYKYAVVRNLLYNKDKNIEIMVNYEPNLFYLGEWFKQLFGESEGKDGKGIFPASLNFTTDLHSMGQYIQDGRKNIFETVLNVGKSKKDIKVKEDKDNLDGLNYLSGRTLDYINKKAMEGTIKAHVDGRVPNLMINIPELNPYYAGYLFYFLEKSCGLSGYLLGVNPFNQPGVEAYKKNMFQLLGKPGY
ncbi:MAG TPA: glucose-6-phosphate isomerase [Clostridiales bacterium]|nr:glucose-6-phosphate isomerase [Clostridiales bacterium]